MLSQMEQKMRSSERPLTNARTDFDLIKEWWKECLDNERHFTDERHALLIEGWDYGGGYPWKCWVRIPALLSSFTDWCDKMRVRHPAETMGTVAFGSYIRRMDETIVSKAMKTRMVSEETGLVVRQVVRVYLFEIVAAHQDVYDIVNVRKQRLPKPDD